MTSPTPLKTLLPLRLAAQPDELFSSWVVRLAAAHGMKVSSLCNLLLGRKIYSNSDMDGMAGEPLLRLFANATGHDAESFFEEHSLKGFSGTLFPKLNQTAGTVWVLPLRSYFSMRPALQYCPLCLTESPAYFRRIWRLSLFTVCPVHNVTLHHICKNCSSPAHPIKNALRKGVGTLIHCWKCGHDLSETPTEKALAPDTRLANDWLCALSDGVAPAAGPCNISVQAYFAGLAMLCAKLLARTPRLKRWRELAAQTAGIQSLPSPLGRHVVTMFEALADPSERRSVLRTAGWLLESWPHRFLEIAQTAGTRTHDFAPYFVKSPEWFREPLRSCLTPSKPKKITSPETLSPGKLRADRRREILLANRREWWPSAQDRLIRRLRKAGIYPAEYRDEKIVPGLRRLIAKLYKERANLRRELTLQVERNTLEWSHLMVVACPFRKPRFLKTEELHRAIRLLCDGRFLSGFDLGELLHRNQVSLVFNHLVPMARSGELEAKFPVKRNGLSFVHPQQAYRTTARSEGDAGTSDRTGEGEAALH